MEWERVILIIWKIFSISTNGGLAIAIQPNRWLSKEIENRSKQKIHLLSGRQLTTRHTNATPSEIVS